MVAGAEPGKRPFIEAIELVHQLESGKGSMPYGEERSPVRNPAGELISAAVALGIDARVADGTATPVGVTTVGSTGAAEADGASAAGAVDPADAEGLGAGALGAGATGASAVPALPARQAARLVSSMTRTMMAGRLSFDLDIRLCSRWPGAGPDGSNGNHSSVPALITHDASQGFATAAAGDCLDEAAKNRFAFGRIAERRQRHDADVRRDTEQLAYRVFIEAADPAGAQSEGGRGQHQVFQRNGCVHRPIRQVSMQPALARFRAGDNHHRRRAQPMVDRIAVDALGSQLADCGGVTHDEEAPALAVAPGWRHARGFEALDDQFVGHRIRAVGTHAVAAIDDVEELHRPSLRSTRNDTKRCSS